MRAARYSKSDEKASPASTVDFIGSTRRNMPALVYVDENNVNDGKPDQRYIDTIDMGIADAFTIPQEYAQASAKLKSGAVFHYP